MRDWQSIVSSGNGTLLAASVRGGSTFVSRDAGATWAETKKVGYAVSMASSSDGTKLVAGVRGVSIYVSDDAGLSWYVRFSTSAGTRLWRSVASSADGARLAAVEELGYCYTSVDRGMSWTRRLGTGSLQWLGLAGSANGSVLVGSVYNRTARTFSLLGSTDGGATWSTRSATTGYYLAASADGTKLVAAAYNGPLRRSTNGGRNWTVLAGAGTRAWSSVASSADGSRLAAVVYGGYIYTSSNSGATWDP